MVYNEYVKEFKGKIFDEKKCAFELYKMAKDSAGFNKCEEKLQDKIFKLCYEIYEVWSDEFKFDQIAKFMLNLVELAKDEDREVVIDKIYKQFNSMPFSIETILEKIKSV